MTIFLLKSITEGSNRNWGLMLSHLMTGEWVSLTERSMAMGMKISKSPASFGENSALNL